MVMFGYECSASLKEFFNDIFLKIRDHEYINIAE